MTSSLIFLLYDYKQQTYRYIGSGVNVDNEMSLMAIPSDVIRMMMDDMTSRDLANLLEVCTKLSEVTEDELRHRTQSLGYVNTGTMRPSMMALQLRQSQEGGQLARFIKDKSIQMRLAALDSLSELDSSVIGMNIDYVREAMKDSDGLVRLYALHALGRHEDVLEHYKNDVSEMTNDDDPRVSSAAKDILDGKVRRRPPSVFLEETKAAVHSIDPASFILHLHERRVLSNIYGRDMYTYDRDLARRLRAQVAEGGHAAWWH